MKKIETKFIFCSKNIIEAKKIINKYPKKFSQSAILPLLHLAQDQLNGWLNKSSLQYISNFLKIPLIRVYEVASFYHMFNLKKVGKNCINVCTTTPCWLRGSDSILSKFKKKLKISNDEVTKDNLFSVHEIECLGACIDAPVVKINNDYYENLNLNDIDKLIDNLKK